MGIYEVLKFNNNTVKQSNAPAESLIKRCFIATVHIVKVSRHATIWFAFDHLMQYSGLCLGLLLL